MSNISVSQRLGDLKADLMIEVVAQDEVGDLARGFRTMELFIDVCRKLSGALLPDAPPSLRPLIVVEDIDSHSVIAWLRLDFSLGQPGPDEAIEYVNGGIMESAKWLSNCRAGADFQRLLGNLEALHGKSSRLPPPDSAKLLRALCEFQDARTSLATRDQVLFVAESGGVRLDRSSLVPTDCLLRSAARWHVKNEATELLLVVSAPDYSGGNIWSVQHNGATVDVSIQDRAWLNAFENREIDVREGDVLRAVAITEQHYAADGTLLNAQIRITSIQETTTLKGAAPTTTAQPTPVGADAPPKFAAPSSSNGINLSYSGPITGNRAYSTATPT